MRTVTLATLISLSLCCCQKAAAPGPPPLPSKPDAALKGAMWSMATDTSALFELLGKAATPTPAEVGEARRLIDEVKKTASSLAGDPALRGHPILGEGLPAFLADVEASRLALAKEPPDTGPAMRLAASCRSCHGVAMRAQAPDERLALR